MAARSRRRLRPGAAVFVMCTAWMLGFVHGLGPAEQAGTVEQRAAAYQRYLGSGWYPLEVDPLASAHGPTRWIALNESRGPVSAIDPARWWRAMTLRLAPVPCHGDRPQAVEVRQGMLVLARWTLPLAWASYTVTLRAPGRPVTLHYRCTVGVSAPGRGLRSARELAILLGGLEGTPGHSRPTIPVQRTH